MLDKCCKDVCNMINDHIATTDKRIEYTDTIREYAAKKYGQKATGDVVKKRLTSQKSIIEKVKQELKDKDFCKC